MFLLKVRAFQARRVQRDLLDGVQALGISRKGRDGDILAESRTALYPSQVPAEFGLQAGKVQNLRVAGGCVDGVVIRQGEMFSFWAQVGRPTRARGFAEGRELREGCIIPSIGGGLCQLSNALYDVALIAGCEIVERHAHSQRVPGSMAAVGRDATVFWNYVDLRFRAVVDCRLEVELTERELRVRLRAMVGNGINRTNGTYKVTERVVGVGTDGAAAESCETCGVTGCFRHVEKPHAECGLTAWMVDGWWPEFDLAIQQRRKEGDWLLMPLRGQRFRNYRWDMRGFARRVRQAPLETLWRSLGSRRLAAQGAERQRALLRYDEQLARRYARQLPPEALHLVVSQGLLPHLWRAGALGGRSFDVMMTRLPMRALEATLDRAAARHPDCGTLVDFRAPPELVEAEEEALAEARHWITPHSGIARIGGGRAVKLAWQIPPRDHFGERGNDVLFPASTLGRKGAYELAEAARELGLRVQLGGAMLEGTKCWRGIETGRASENWEGVGIVALPAWVEHQPRVLLRAVSAGLPVIAGEGCGLEGVAGVTTIAEGDIAGLKNALLRLTRYETPVAAGH